MEISSRLAKFTSEAPPCCLQVKDHIYLGTYTLHKEDGSRSGTIEIYDKKTFKLITKVDTTSAVLDIKISSHDELLMITAHSTGNLTIWKLDEETRIPKLVNNIKVFDEDVLITSVIISPLEANKVLATLTGGELAIIDLNVLEIDLLDTLHSLECWTGNFGELGELSNVVYTGGDDAKLIAHDLRTLSEIWTSSRHHQAGVVSILSPLENWNTANSNHLWTGSYDDHLRILDLRVIDKSSPALIPSYQPKILYEENLGGGVWRLIPTSLNKDDVLVCCMYDGARIVSLLGDSKFEIKKYYKGDHESMCYGGDWASALQVVTCSFYDNVVEVWEP